MSPHSGEVRCQTRDDGGKHQRAHKAAIARIEAREIKLASAARDMRQATVELPGGRALRLTYRVKRDAVVYQYFVRRADLLYVLTYTASSTAAPRYAKIFDMSARTFELR